MPAKTIFLVESREGFSGPFKQFAEKAGFEIVGIVDEGGVAIERIQKMSDPPEIVVLSLSVDTGLDGIATIKKMNAQGIAVKPVVSYTIDSKMRLVEALKAGALDRIKKPFSEEDVIKRLTRVHLTKSIKSGGSGAIMFRNSVRLAKPIPVQYSKDSILAAKKDARTLDISTDGCKIQTTSIIKKKDRIKLFIELPGVGKVKAAGKVMNVDHNQLHSTYEAGIAFDKISDKDTEKLNVYIMNEAAKL